MLNDGTMTNIEITSSFSNNSWYCCKPKPPNIVLTSLQHSSVGVTAIIYGVIGDANDLDTHVDTSRRLIALGEKSNEDPLIGGIGVRGERTSEKNWNSRSAWLW